MFESMPEISTAMKALAFVVTPIFAVALVAWLVRRYGADRLSGAGARGRQPRLGVVDQIDMDSRRKLVIVRRDNVEHLVMIGGPTDVVVEQNIVRGASRDKADAALGRNVSGSETLARPVPLGEGTPFPLQPENNGRTTRAQEETVQWTWPPHTETPKESPARTEPRLDKVEPPAKPAADFSATPREPSFARPVVAPPAPRPAPTPAVPAPAAPGPAAEKIEKPAPVAAPEDNLAEMANRLEASFRRPPEPRVTETPAPLKPEPVVPPALRADPEQRPAPPEPKPAKAEAPAKGAFESLEEEMASLLGRPPGKT